MSTRVVSDAAQKGSSVRSPIGIIATIFALGATVAVASGIPGKIAFIGLDHQVYLVDPNGGEPRALTRGDAGRMAAGSPALMPSTYAQDQPASEQRFSWPSWSPSGQTLLVQGVTVALGGAAQQAGIYRLDLEHPGTVVPIYENRERGPIYLYFSPTGRDVAVLLTEPGALGLALLPAEGGELRQIGRAHV